MTIRAKFVVYSKDMDGVVILNPVTDNSEENKAFYRYTPGGQISLRTVNKTVRDEFEVGEEYYVDFRRADAAPFVGL